MFSHFSKPHVAAAGMCLAVVTGLYLTSLYNYLLFHSIAEGFSIVVGFSMFSIAWHSRKIIENNLLLVLGIAYLFLSGLDFLHTLSYKGMNIFTDYDYYANQLWIAARYMESLVILAGLVLLHMNKKIDPNLIVFICMVLTAVILGTIFYWKIFPICFVEGKGLTPFKKVSEYIISFILLADIVFLISLKDRFNPKVFQLVVWSIGFTIGSELAFTFYISNYGFSNLVGHYFKIASFYLIYRAIVVTGISDPYNLIFRELVASRSRIEKAREAADLMSRAKSEFLANMSHELRTPLNAIIGFSEVLHAKYFGDLNAKQTRYVKDIHEAGKHLLALINDILDLSKVEAGKMDLDLKKVEIKALLENSLFMIKEKCMNHRIALNVELPDKLSQFVFQGDEQKLKQILFNLLSNAAKFTPDHGKICVTADLMRDDGQKGGEAKDGGEEDVPSIVVSVADTGIGIAPGDLARVFNEFEQLEHSDDRKCEGTGLGLALTRRLVELHGGKIHVDSEGEGKGSIFSFTLPVPAPEAENRTV